MTLLKFYWESDEDPAVLREMARDWIEILGPFPEAAIAEACRAYLVEEPRKRPTPGAIRALAVKAMDRDRRLAPALPLPERPKLAAPERVRVTPEAAARILAEAGMTPERMAGVLRGRAMPRPGRAVWDDTPPEPESIPTPEEIVARPYPPGYLEALRARLAAQRGEQPTDAQEAAQ